MALECNLFVNLKEPQAKKLLDSNKTSISELPLKLENCPIVDSVVEVRFISGVVPQGVFGIAYENLKSKYPQIEQLPILQLPAVLIERDPNFKDKPHYKIKGKEFTIQIGPTVVAVSPNMPYPGWSAFSTQIHEVYKTLIDRKIIKQITRLGIRYTNFFPQTDIFDKINLQIQYNNKPIPYQRTVLRTELPENSFNNTLQVSNEATRTNPPKGVELGSLIDIDTYKNYEPDNNLELSALIRDIEQGHKIEKRIFWDLLDDELKKDLRPVYR